MMGEDLLACVLGCVYTEVEKTLIEPRRSGVAGSSRLLQHFGIRGR
jgi:hypothetical protein